MASMYFNFIRNQSFLITFTNKSYFPAGNRDKVVSVYIFLWDWKKKSFNNSVSDKLDKREMTTFKEFKSRSDPGNNPYIKALFTLAEKNLQRVKQIKCMSEQGRSFITCGIDKWENQKKL